MEETRYPNNVSARDAYLTPVSYQRLYDESIEDPVTFWKTQAKLFLHFFEEPKTIMTGSLAKGDVTWFDGATLNVCYHCIDRHLQSHGNQTAIIWEGDEPSRSKPISYNELYKHVCRFANVLKAQGIKKGDRVCIYLPMIPEACYAMLACARIGAVHCVVFGGFSSIALRDRIVDAKCKLVITADAGLRGGVSIPLKSNVDQALTACPEVTCVLVIKYAKTKINWIEKRDIDFYQQAESVAAECPAESMSAEDPLFILYTSGSTGKPKGVLHTTAAYLLYAAITHHYAFNYQPGDIYWCTADVGWITGHSYIVYGPLANGATTIIYEGTPMHPTPARFWQIIDKHHVNIFYTAPTAIRALMAEGDTFLKTTSRQSCRLLGTVGEPINPEAWRWYYENVGNSEAPIIDTWWQTETGGLMITPLPGVSTLKPGSATKPFFGIQVALLDDTGKEITGEGEGELVISSPWPGMMRSINKNHERFMNTYLTPHPGYFVTGDSARRDKDGDYWITGRIDDVINVSGHRLGTAEIESALVAHEAVAEAAVVSIPHPIKGQALIAFVTLIHGRETSNALIDTLKQQVREVIGSFAKPQEIHFAAQLPKTRSGKIMRRLLRKIATGETADLGDTSTLADPSVLEKIIHEKSDK